VQTLGVRFVARRVTLEEAADLGCRACGSPGGGCQFLGTAATSQVVGEALGMSLGHSALAPSGHPIWIDMARRSATALMALEHQQSTMRDVVTSAPRNAMVVFAAFGGSTNLILHVPAIAHAAGLRRPTPLIGPRSIGWCRAWSTRFQTDRAIIRRCRYSWLEACPK
jgi:dihydroxyacid dehydratase/phosphogluconate dehydratase